MSNSAENHDTVDEAIPLKPLMSPQTRVVMGDVEEVPLHTVPGLGNQHNPDSCSGRMSGRLVSCCRDQNHRKLAVCSIICGVSCIGITALINSVKAESATDPEAAARFSRRARKFGIISIVLWVSILISIPLLMALISYLITLQD